MIDAVPMDPVEVFARTLYAEARTPDLPAIEALAAVVVNRVPWSADWAVRAAAVREACLAPWQFACWDPDPATRAAMATAPGGQVLKLCRRVARRALAGTLVDPTRGATRYHDRDSAPVWARGRAPAAEIGGVLFYNDLR